MATFVTFEHRSDGTLALGVDHVVRIEQALEGSTIHLSDGAEIEVKEVFSEVLEKLGWKDER